MLSISAVLLFILIGLTIIDSDLAMQKKQEVKALLELANHHATFAVIEELKTEGIIELDVNEAMRRFQERMLENGGYIRTNQTFIPSASSVTTDSLPFTHYYVDFQSWRKDVYMTLRYQGENIIVQQVNTGTEERPAGGRLFTTIYDQDGRMIQLAPKTLVGPSMVIVAFVHERPFTPLLSGHSFPVMSVEEIKW